MLPLSPQNPQYVPHYDVCCSTAKLELKDLYLPLKHINLDNEIRLIHSPQRPRSPSVVVQHEWSPHSTRSLRQRLRRPFKSKSRTTSPSQSSLSSHVFTSSTAQQLGSSPTGKLRSPSCYELLTGIGIKDVFLGKGRYLSEVCMRSRRNVLSVSRTKQ